MLKMIPLGEYARLQGGFAFKSEEFVTDGIPIVRISNIVNGGINLTENTVYYHPTDIPQAFIVNQGDLLIAMSGATTGKVGRYREKQSAYLNQRVGKFEVIDNNSLDYEYLVQVVMSNRFRFKVDQLLSISAQPNISGKDIEDIIIPLPPLPEQCKIAEILSTWDRAIELTDKLIATKEHHKKALMQRLLTGKVRFPGFIEPWEEVRLESLGSCIRGVSYKPDKDLRDGDGINTVRLLRANNIVDGRLFLSEIQYVDSVRCKSDQILRDGDVVICMSSGSKELVGKTAEFNGLNDFTYTVGAFCSIFRPHSAGEAGIIHQYFNSGLYRRGLRTRYAGTNINNLKPSDIESLNVALPKDQGEMEAVALTLRAADMEISLLVSKREALVNQKKGLMQQLLTGNKRVKVEEG